jgi:hypothetical protein
MGKARTSRIQATRKRLPKIKRLMLPQEVMKYGPLLFLTKQQSMVNFIVQFCQFPSTYTTTVESLRQKLLSARRCNLPLCFDCAMIIERRLCRQVNRSSLTSHWATSFARSPPQIDYFYWVKSKQLCIYRSHFLWMNLRSESQIQSMQSTSWKRKIFQVKISGLKMQMMVVTLKVNNLNCTALKL